MTDSLFSNFGRIAAFATTPTAAKQLQSFCQSRVLWVGIGCKGETSRELIELAIQQVCHNYHLELGAIAGIATIDLKADEIGLIALCQGQNWQLKTFPADILSSISVPNPSNIVATEVGTFSVAEAAAICATINPESLAKNSINNLLVPKQIFRLEGQLGAVTVAIALEKEYIRPGG